MTGEALSRVSRMWRARDTLVTPNYVAQPPPLCSSTTSLHCHYGDCTSITWCKWICMYKIRAWAVGTCIVQSSGTNIPSQKDAEGPRRTQSGSVSVSKGRLIKQLPQPQAFQAGSSRNTQKWRLILLLSLPIKTVRTFRKSTQSLAMINVKVEKAKLSEWRTLKRL